MVDHRCFSGFSAGENRLFSLSKSTDTGGFEGFEVRFCWFNVQRQGLNPRGTSMPEWQDEGGFLPIHRFHRRSKHGNFPDYG